MKIDKFSLITISLVAVLIIIVASNPYYIIKLQEQQLNKTSILEQKLLSDNRRVLDNITTNLNNKSGEHGDILQFIKVAGQSRAKDFETVKQAVINATTNVKQYIQSQIILQNRIISYQHSIIENLHRIIKNMDSNDTSSNNVVINAAKKVK